MLILFNLASCYYSEMKINKEKLICYIILHLEKELANCEQAARNAHLAATDDQSVAETQYDTLAIESAYLAEGQSRRIIEFKKAITGFEQLKSHLKAINAKAKNNDVQSKTSSLIVNIGSLVQLAEDTEALHWFFIAPSAAGYRTQLASQHITVVTPQSPMGMVLMGKQEEDEIQLTLGSKKLIDEIAYIR